LVSTARPRRGGERIYLDRGLTGTNRRRPGLDQALAAVRSGDTLVVPKLDRLARSVPDARDIGDSLVDRGVKLSLGGTSYDPSDPMGKMFFNILATFAEFEVDLLRMRTREGMAIARAKGKLRGRQPQAELRAAGASGEAARRRRALHRRAGRVVLGVATNGVPRARARPAGPSKEVVPRQATFALSGSLGTTLTATV
jgi:DNA invertase Pin-like site-specific DNA recombinase